MADRTIPVTQEWFEQLEGYLQAHERFADKELFADGTMSLMLITPEGRRLLFVLERS